MVREREDTVGQRGEELRKIDGEETDGSRDWKEVVRIERLMGNLAGWVFCFVFVFFHFLTTCNAFVSLILKIQDKFKQGVFHKVYCSFLPLFLIAICSGPWASHGREKRKEWEGEKGAGRREDTALAIVKRMVGWTTIETGKGNGVYVWQAYVTG